MTSRGRNAGGLIAEGEHRQTGFEGFAGNCQRTRTRRKENGGGATLKGGDRAQEITRGHGGGLTTGGKCDNATDTSLPQMIWR